jgi:hypothetical protein
VGVAMLVGLFGIWRVQAASTQSHKATERSAHARLYGELASPGAVGGGRVDGITVTDARVVRDDRVTDGRRHLYFTVVNSGQPDDLVGVVVDSSPVPVAPVSLATGATVRFMPGGRSYVLPDDASTPVHVTLTFRHAAPVGFEAPASTG